MATGEPRRVTPGQARPSVNPIPAEYDILLTMWSDWDSFYEVHFHRVVRFVMLNGASQEDALDATQEAFIASWSLMNTDPGRWQEITSKEAWVRKVALRKYYRPSGSRRRPSETEVFEILDRP